ncbi:MAG: DUF4012 domain-containing protein [Acidimicrobiia bacterium]
MDDAADDDGISPAAPALVPARRRARRRWIVAGILVVVVGWLAVAGLQLLAARRAAVRGIDRLEAFKRTLSPAELIRGHGLDELRRAERDFASAGDDLGSPFVAPLRYLPVLGRQVRSVDALTHSARHVIGAGTTAVTDARREIHGRQSSGPGRVAIVERLGGIAARTSLRLRSVDLGPSEALVGPVARARDRFARELDRLREGLHSTSTASRGMSDFLRGPSRYLVLAANNAEMRGGSGMWLSAGELSVDRGSFHVDHMQPTSELILDPAIAPPIEDADLDARWGWMAPNREWRNLAASPRFAPNAELAASMWKARTGRQVDGVLVLDPVALRAVLAATGPVEVDGLVLDESNVVDEILHKQYQDFPVDAEQSASRRHEILSDAAVEVLRALDGRHWDVAKLVEELSAAARGRHLLAWSRLHPEQAAWAAADVDGGLRPDSVGVAVLSQGGNKLDQWIVIGARLRTAPSATGTGVTLDVTLANHAPHGEPVYVAGPTAQLAEGTYAGILSLTLPGHARDVHLDGTPRLVAAGPDGPAQVVATRVQLARDQEARFRIRWSLPRGARSLSVEPSARVPTVTWRHGVAVWADDRSRTVRW